MKIKIYKLKTGFTLIELIVAVAIVAILTGSIILILNPLNQLAQARNNQRISHINVIASATKERLLEYHGAFEKDCPVGALPTTTKQIGTGSGNYNLGLCVIPNYLSVMPLDPSVGTTSATGYNILYSTSTMQITISASNAELGKVISVIR